MIQPILEELFEALEDHRVLALILGFIIFMILLPFKVIERLGDRK